MAPGAILLPCRIAGHLPGHWYFLDRWKAGSTVPKMQDANANRKLVFKKPLRPFLGNHRGRLMRQGGATHAPPPPSARQKRVPLVECLPGTS